MNGTGSGQERHPIAAVQEGMQVLDSTGEEIGTVKFVKLGDPDAVTGAGQLTDEGGGLAAEVSRAFAGPAEPDVPEGLAERLLRVGYVKIDAKGLFARDLYASADEVADVVDDTVRLTTTRDQLATKA